MNTWLFTLRVLLLLVEHFFFITLCSLVLLFFHGRFDDFPWLSSNYKRIPAVLRFNLISVSRGPFFEGPQTFSHPGPVSRKQWLYGPEKFPGLSRNGTPESHSKISNLMITVRAVSFTYSNINRGSLHTRSFRRIHGSVWLHSSNSMQN